MNSKQKFRTEYNISLLVAGYLRGDLTPGQEKELNDWIQASSVNKDWLLNFCGEANIDQQIRKYSTADKEAIWNKTRSKILNAGKSPVKASILLWQRMIAAAVILLIVGVSVYLFKANFKTDHTSYLVNHAGLIKPGSNKAYLITADGQRISLTDAADGQLAKESGVSIVKSKDGQVVYKVTGGTTINRTDEKIRMNTIETPRGGQYQIELPDGTRVWLNAASTLKFPSTFSPLKKDRTVEMIGEAYFEVSKDKNRPFVVKSNDQEVKVLGTHFNVKSYKEEGTAKTTLLEGSVQVSTDDKQEVILKPGQQSLVKDRVIEVKSADTELAIAWKNNKFMFEEENIRTVMAMVERWYDVDVVYKGEVTDDLFGGSMSRVDDIAEVLKSLQLTGKVHFKIEGRRVLVTK